MTTILCEAGGVTHEHQFPDDWILGGADGTHPGADVRYKPTHYEYLSKDLKVVHITSAPVCDMQALEEFTKIAAWGLNPALVLVRHPDTPISMLPYWYDSTTDEIHEGMLEL